jgi:hypothetical protein
VSRPGRRAVKDCILVPPSPTLCGPPGLEGWLTWGVGWEVLRGCWGAAFVCGTKSSCASIAAMDSS